MANYIGEIAPHGGVLIDRMLRGAEREAAIARATTLTGFPMPLAFAFIILVNAVGIAAALTPMERNAEAWSAKKRIRIVVTPKRPPRRSRSS